MTVIAYRDGVMAADSRAWSGGHSPIGAKTKIRCVDGVLIGCASSVPGGAEHTIAWYLAGADPAAVMPKDFQILIVKADGTALYADDHPYLSGPLTAEYFAIGSGRQFLLGALYCGATAVDAIAAGIALDTVSGGQIVSLTHDGKEP